MGKDTLLGKDMHAEESLALPASLWAATAAPAPDYARAKGDAVADVAIVGAGYTGLSTALHLSQAGRKVVVVEASEPGWGASGRNGGQIIAGLKHDPDKLEARFGQALGGAITRTFGAGGDLVFDIIEKYGIDCHAERSGWIQGAHGPGPFSDIVTPPLPAMARPRRSRRACSIPARWPSSPALPPAPIMAAGSDPRGGVLQPQSYARGLAAAAMSHGRHHPGPVAGAWPASRWRRLAARSWPGLGSGRARSYSPPMPIPAISGRGCARPSFRSPVSRSPRIRWRRRCAKPSLPGGQGVADTRRLLLYFRLDHEGRLVMGGRSPVDDNPTMGDAAPLKAALARIFPQAAGAPVEFVWSGKVAITKDTMPHIHILAPGLLTALGCNGRGVAACTTTGKLLADLALGTAPADLPFPVTAPDRYALHALRKVGVFAFSQYYRLLDSRSAA